MFSNTTTASSFEDAFSACVFQGMNELIADHFRRESVIELFFLYVLFWWVSSILTIFSRIC